MLKICWGSEGALEPREEDPFQLYITSITVQTRENGAGAAAR